MGHFKNYQKWRRVFSLLNGDQNQTIDLEQKKVKIVYVFLCTWKLSVHIFQYNITVLLYLQLFRKDSVRRWKGDLWVLFYQKIFWINQLNFKELYTIELPIIMICLSRVWLYCTSIKVFACSNRTRLKIQSPLTLYIWKLAMPQIGCHKKN